MTLELDTDRRYQEIDGFGTAVINYKEFPEEYDDPGFIDRVVNDLGLSLLRIPITEHLEYENDDADPDHFNWEGFYLSDNHHRRGLEKSMELARKFKKAGVKRFMMSPWSPPQFMKTNRAPIQGGYLRHDMTSEFAEYLAAVVILAKNNYDIDVNWVSLQNESIFIQFYRSCLYHPEMMREAVRAVMRKFEREGIRTQLLLNEDMLFAERIYDGVAPTLEDEETGTFDGHIAVHRKQGKEGLVELNRLLQPYDRKLWMTETSGHEANWPGAFKLANDIHEYLVYGNFSAWLYWQISGNTGSSDPGRYTLMLEGEPTKKYYTSKHFYKFVRPGAVRIEAGTSLPADSVRVSAFHHPADGTLTVVLINNTDGEVTTTISGKGELPDSMAYYVTTEDLDCEERNARAVNSKITLPAWSIVTLYGHHPALKTKARSELPVTVQLPGDKYGGQLGNQEPTPLDREWQRATDGHADLSAEAEAYLQAGNIDSTQTNGWTVLHNAALNGDCRALNFALNNGADVNARAEDGWTPLHAAAAGFVGKKQSDDGGGKCTKYDVFTTVLAAEPDLELRTTDGLTALHAAVMNANTAFRQDENDALKKVTDLIEAGVEIDATDTAGRTALHWASMQGYTHFTDNKLEVEGDVVAALLSGGADRKVKDKAGMRPIDYARKMGYRPIIDVLTDRNANEPVTESAERRQYGPELLQAAWRGDRDEVRRLLDLKADTGYLDTDGFSALERARDNGHADIVAMIKAYNEKQ